MQIQALLTAAAINLKLLARRGPGAQAGWAAASHVQNCVRPVLAGLSAALRTVLKLPTQPLLRQVASSG
jgi:hypothetical protein